MEQCIIVSQSAMKRLSAVVPDEEYNRIEKLVKAGAARSVAQLVRQAVSEYAEKLQSGKLLALREVPPQQARREVEKYLRTHPGVVWPDEMAEKLAIDYRIILKAVSGLMKEGKAEEAEAEVIQV